MRSLLIEWRDAVLSDDGPEDSNSRLVACALAKHSDGSGGSIHPSIALLSRETGLSEKTVRTHVRRLECTGWIEISIAGLGGQGWRRHQYSLRLPEGAATVTAGSRKVRQQLPDVSGEGAVTDDIKVRSQLPMRTSIEGAQVYTPHFDEVWDAYPRRAGGNSKSAAARKWKATLRRGNDPSEVLAGVRRYAAWCDATGKTSSEFVKQAATLLGPDEHWRGEWTVPSTNGRGPRSQPSVSGAQAAIRALEEAGK